MYIVPMTKDSEKFEVFLSVIPGLESFCINEIDEKRKQLELSQIIQREELTLKSVDLASVLNFIKFLRTPTRALLRIKNFTARDLPKLYRQLKKVSWNDYIPTTNFKIKVSSHNSRLFDDRKIEKAVRDAIRDYQKASPYKAKYDSLKWSESPIIFIRFNDDLCQLSIDCSGERLDKRGHKLATSKAPMRESLAAALISFINEKDATLVDPMAGSGTIISEYLQQDNVNDARILNFQNFPIYRKLPLQKQTLLNEKKTRRAKAFDIDESNCQAIKANLGELDVDLTITQEDFFKRDECYTNDDFIIACNLPYGKRIKTDQNIHKFVDKFLSHGLALKAKAIYIVVPETFIIDNKKFNVQRSQRINNGGIWIQFIKVTGRP